MVHWWPSLTSCPCSLLTNFCLSAPNRDDPALLVIKCIGFYVPSFYSQKLGTALVSHFMNELSFYIRISSF
jgi:hypothetical protein